MHLWRHRAPGPARPGELARVPVRHRGPHHLSWDVRHLQPGEDEHQLALQRDRQHRHLEPQGTGTRPIGLGPHDPRARAQGALHPFRHRAYGHGGVAITGCENDTEFIRRLLLLQPSVAQWQVEGGLPAGGVLAAPPQGPARRLGRGDPRRGPLRRARGLVCGCREERDGAGGCESDAGAGRHGRHRALGRRGGAPGGSEAVASADPRKTWCSRHAKPFRSIIRFRHPAR
mmetsp:Transcript_27636/g.60887  ORF Transcript_27636/g.60887 Transcript_27636/m.60887 type:complete len:230 (+) Transcript_27636:786-1475(+)